MESIVSLQRLAWMVGYELAMLRAVARDAESHYECWSKFNPKKNKSIEYQTPSVELKKLQKRLNRQVFNQIALSDAAHGAVRGRSPRTNAEPHLGAKLVVTVDVYEYFKSARNGVVFAMFRRDFGFGTDVSFLLTRLTTFQGRLPRGAPTSPVIANLLMTALVDAPLLARAHELGVTYTRFVDDLTFSGENPRQMIGEAAALMSKLKLRIHRSSKKLRIRKGDERQIVTGLTVNNSQGVGVGRARVSAIRATIHQYSRLAPELRPNSVRSIRGRIGHVELFSVGAANRLTQQLNAALAAEVPQASP